MGFFHVKRCWRFKLIKSILNQQKKTKYLKKKITGKYFKIKKKTSRKINTKWRLNLSNNSFKMYVTYASFALNMFYNKFHTNWKHNIDILEWLKFTYEIYTNQIIRGKSQTKSPFLNYISKERFYFNSLLKSIFKTFM